MPQQFNTIDVPYDGKVYTCRPTHRAIFHAEKALGLNILTPNEPHLFRQPAGYMIAVLSWILLRTKLPTLDLDDCFDEVFADMPRYDAIAGQFVEALKGTLPWMPKEDAKAEAPLAASSSGESDGQPPASSCESQTESSGD
jgi:hypothetical protein